MGEDSIVLGSKGVSFLDWLNKLNFKEASSELALLQRNTLLEKENH